MLTELQLPNALIESNGRVVWVNDATGCCIGRFSGAGVDVHRSGPDQVRYGTQCLACFHDGTPAENWVRFKRAMIQFHDVQVPEYFRPEFAKEPA